MIAQVITDTRNGVSGQIQRFNIGAQGVSAHAFGHRVVTRAYVVGLHDGIGCIDDVAVVTVTAIHDVGRVTAD